MNLNEKLKALFGEQTEKWELAKTNFSNLAKIEQRTLAFDGAKIVLQHNPARIVSSGAKVDTKSIEARPCFLCEANRPKEQKTIDFGEHFQLSVNPFPILPFHTTIIAKTHEAQRILPYFDDFLSLAKELTDFVVLYNGPKCGASAPDHLHFQAVKKGHLPLETEVKTLKDSAKGILLPCGISAFSLQNYLRTCIVIESEEKQKIAEAFQYFYDEWKSAGTDDEPMMNIFCWHNGKQWTLCLFPRNAHRPTYYFNESEHFLVSPGTIDMGGTIILAQRQDFENMTAEIVQNIFRQVSRNVSEPEVAVGIMHGERICFSLNGKFMLPTGRAFSGEQEAVFSDGEIFFGNENFTELTFLPTQENSDFELKNVTIGVNFHWERKENQRFEGKLRFLVENDSLVAINILPVEKYLKSVISSEMSATAGKELLKAHAVISRSWLLANMRHAESLQTQTKNETDGEHICWYERDAHTLYDVCADDHCQRYQGITRTSTATAAQAVDETRGEVLVCNGEICDARFSKSCGGISETFENCWDDTPKSYLTNVIDAPAAPKNFDLDLTNEANARKWILQSPEAFCNTTDKNILAKVLNNYDQETTDFYRWKVEYTTEEISALVRKRSGIDFGEILELVPVERGKSGRLVRLKIVGTKRSVVVGKELEIRKWLSPSHLYSSAFVAEKMPDGFVLYGAGWGHGVGLCQIGAAVMSEKGYKYREILLHYYRGNTKVERKY